MDALFSKLNRKSLRNQRGISFLELTIGLIILSAFAIFLVPRLSGLLGKSNIEIAQQEIVSIVTASEQYRRVNSTFVGLSFATLDTGGYHIEPFSATNTTNVYGDAMTLAAAGSPVGSQASLGYTTSTNGSCQQLLNRNDNLFDQAAVSCAGVVLTILW